jgi:hypothetical protein
MSTESQFIIPFLQQVISDIQTNQLTPKQIAECSRFYLNYTTTIPQSTFSYTEMDCLTAGITFYKTLTSSLALDSSISEEPN